MQLGIKLVSFLSMKNFISWVNNFETLCGYCLLFRVKLFAWSFQDEDLGQSYSRAATVLLRIDHNLYVMTRLYYSEVSHLRHKNGFHCLSNKIT